MNDVSLNPEIVELEAEMELEMPQFPVIPNPEGEVTGYVTKLGFTPEILQVKDPEVHDWARAEEKPTYTKAEVGLGNVDNTSDLNKPISTATQTALDGKVDNVPGKALSTNDYTDTDKAIVDGVTSALDGKVDKVQGKGLSTNDFTDEEKTIVDGTPSALDNKVDKVEGKGLSENDFTDTLKTKLDGIEAEANKTIVDNSVTSTSTNPVESKAIYNLLNDLLPEATATGNPILITNASGLNAKSLKVELEPIQDTSGGEPSPTNPCPISGRTQTTVSVNNEDTTIQFGQTVYGGEVDVTRGTLKITHAITQITSVGYSANKFYAHQPNNMEKLLSYTIDDVRSNLLPTVSTYNDVNNNALGVTGFVDSQGRYPNQNWIYIGNGDTSITTASQMNTWLANNPLYVCYKLATPIEVTLTAKEISLLKGNNTLVADGDMELIYSKTPQ